MPQFQRGLKQSQMKATNRAAFVTSAQISRVNPCNFLQLPRELRDLIYFFVFDGAFVAIGPFRLWVDGTCFHYDPRDYGYKLFQYGSGEPRYRYDKLPCRFLDSYWHTGWHKPMEMRNVPQAIGHNENDVDMQESLLYRTLPLIQDRKCTSKNPETANSHLFDVALLFTSRQTHYEFASVVYSRSLFAFGSQRRLLDFLIERPGSVFNLSHLPRALPVSTLNLALITFISLECRPHGRPTSIETRHLQLRYYNSWRYACSLIAFKLSSLTHLTLFIEIPLGGPYRLKTTSIWARPFLELAQSTSLRTVAVNLCAPSVSLFGVDSKALDAFAEVMRRKILHWDNARVMETISFHKELYPKETKTWEMLEGWLTREDTMKI